MILRFTTGYVDTGDAFESLYPKQLQISQADKRDMVQYATFTYVWEESRIIAEHYGLMCKHMFGVLGEPTPDVTPEYDNEYYAFSTTVLPEYRGLGIAKLLLAYTHGNLRNEGIHSRVIGHATSDAMRRVRLDLGAKILNRHENWYESGRVAYFYEHYL